MPAVKSTTSKPGRASRRAPKKAVKKAASKTNSKRKPANKKTVTKKRRKVSVKKNTTKQKDLSLKPPFESGKSITGPIALRERFSLLVLAPHRFPLVTESFVVQSARVAGLAFVTIGALLTLLHVPGASSHIVASIEAEHLVAMINDPLEDFSSTQTAQSSSQTDDGFLVDPNGSQLAVYADFLLQEDVANDRLVLTFAATEGKDLITTVSFTHLNHTKETNNVFEKVSKTATGVYKATFARADLDPGDHTFAVSVEIFDGTKLERSVWKKLYTVVSESENIPSTKFSADYAPTSNSIITKTVVNDADWVQVYGSRERTGTGVRIGEAEQTSDDTWELTLTPPDTTRNEYTFFAKVGFNGSVFQTERKTVFYSSTAVETEAESELEIATTTDESTSVVADEANKQPKQPILRISDVVLSNVQIIKIEADTATRRVEVYADSGFSNLPLFVGNALKVADNKWEIRWDTMARKNGTYYLYAVSVVDYPHTGTDSVRLSSTKIKAVVENEVAELHSEQESEDATKTDGEKDVETLTKPKTVYTSQSQQLEQEFSVSEPTLKQTVTDLMREYKVDLDQILDSLAVAIRNNDVEAIRVAKENLVTLKSIIIKNSFTSGTEDFIQQINSALEERIARLENDVTFAERIIKDRIGERIVIDTDGDGISDFDEENFYNTDPTKADTDGDGIGDADELLSGTNPNDATASARIEYESPQETGLSRADLLSVREIQTLERIGTATSTKPQALIKGTALPNSFVTLYVFSTPTIVTVKTESDGSWSYTFDQELEDGEHEVYVGVTDNAGRVIAKSEPLRFVKTAEAFTPVASAATEPPIATQAPASNASLFTDKMILLIASISIVIIGLILILLGHYLHAQRREHLVADDGVLSPVS